MPERYLEDRTGRTIKDGDLIQKEDGDIFEIKKIKGGYKIGSFEYTCVDLLNDADAKYWLVVGPFKEERAECDRMEISHGLDVALMNMIGDPSLWEGDKGRSFFKDLSIFLRMGWNGSFIEKHKNHFEKYLLLKSEKEKKNG